MIHYKWQSIEGTKSEKGLNRVAAAGILSSAYSASQH